jgi:hypothetical protein
MVSATAAIPTAIADANVSCVATGRGGGDLGLSGHERATGERRSLGGRRERAVRQVMLRTAQHSTMG